MLEDAGCPVLLTQARLVDGLPAHGAQIIRLDADWEAIARRPDTDPGDADRTGPLTPDNLAYVIYTSGSTGRPKGVMIPHANVHRLLSATDHWFGFGPADVWTGFHSYAFDFSVWEIWGALATGGRLVVVPLETARSAEAFHALLCRERVTVLNQTPSAFYQLSEVALGRDAAALSARVVIFGGEALDLGRLSPWLCQLGDRAPRLVNMYGITETTVHVTYQPITRADAKDKHQSLIGRPIPDLEVYILDPHRNPVPVGVAGELYIGGAGLARGYLNRPELTAERFVADPFSDEPGSRLYRTGDLARYRVDGNIAYLGRLDHQVKVRGFRIEPGEIEAALAAHPGVRECVVIARENAPGDKRLVAYLVPAEDNASPLVTELRSHLGHTLPDYMVPSAFLVIDALPLTPNGKLDRAALPAPEGDRAGLADAYMAPRDAREEILCGIWSSVLGLDRIGVRDDFFELGGHSLLATQVISRLRAAFEVELPLRALFETPTVAGLAARIEDARAEGESSQLAPPIEPVERTGNLPLSFAQDRLWFLDQLGDGSPQYNMPGALRLRGALDRDALARSLGAIAARHESLRTRFVAVEGAPRQVIDAPAPFALAETDLGALDPAARDAEVRRLMRAEAETAFHLDRGPLLRARLLRLDQADHVFLLTMHHIVSDGWSIAVLVDELAALYQGYVTGTPADLPALVIQYADYAAWQRDWMQGAVLERQLGYWWEQLAGAPALLALPTDRPRPAVQGHRGGVAYFTLDEALSARLHGLAQAHGVTLFMVLEAAFACLLSRYGGSEDVLIGFPVANRTRQETEALIGFFVNTLVLRNDLTGDPSFAILLGRVREAALAAYGHQDVPFERVVDAVQPARSLSHSPLFQVMFALQNAATGGVGSDLGQPGLPLTLPGLAAELLAREGVASKFDLTLTMQETASGLAGELEYDTDLFDSATMARMADHLAVLLRGVVDEPDTRLSALPLLSDAERHRLLVEWNDTAVPYPRDSCIHELFDAQVARSPAATALVFEDERLTYAELNARANRLAHHLIDLGVGPETLVGIAVERSIEMVVGLLGILKAGGAYVPLDPGYPAERIAFMLEDAGCPVLLTQAHLEDGLPAHDATVVRLDADWEAIARRPDTNPTDAERTGPLTPKNLAYVIYTSGSTGRPKGVAVCHSGLVNLTVGDSHEFGLETDSVVLQFASLNFDASIWIIAVTLLSGACLVVTNEDASIPGPPLVELMQRHK